MKHALALALATLAALPAVADDCKFSKDHSANVEAAGAKRIVVTAGPGDLTVRGEESRKVVNVTGRACASSQDLLDSLGVETRRDGDVVYIKTLSPSWDEQLFTFRRYAHMDLTVVAPKDASIELEDSSGDLQVTNVQAASVTDSSGDQSIRDIAGDLRVSDSSGEIEIERVGGSLKLNDSSGDVRVDEVRGDVHVVSDSSGDLEIERVAGSVHIAEDSSGDISISEVQRNVTIDSDSSGSISADRVGGDFTVADDGSGSINHSRVMGRVSVPAED
jgi:DUF4097 and DUF4098 domain-containing protein YvlB